MDITMNGFVLVLLIVLVIYLILLKILPDTKKVNFIIAIYGAIVSAIVIILLFLSHLYMP